MMNRMPRTVRVHASRRPDTTGTDRRVRRTRRALVDALVALVMEKGYEAITVQDLLDQADIGRSTFYAHYRGKDDLLIRSFERMLDSIDGVLDQERSARVAAVSELFLHVQHFRGFRGELDRAHMLDRTYDAGVERMTQSIARRLAARSHGNGSVPIPIVARAWAGALFAMLKWWALRGTSSYSAAEMDSIFHGLVTGSVPGDWMEPVATLPADQDCPVPLAR